MYESFYGLSASPFQLNPDPSFLFESKGHRRAHAYLQYGVYQAEGFIVVTGEVGAGKTTLVRALLRELEAEKVVAAQIVSTQLDANDLLRSVALAFGLPAKAGGKAELIGEIEAFLLSLVPQGRRALLVVDEAQNLSLTAMEELRMLSNFQLEQRALLQSFLVGQPQLRDLMRGNSMQQLRQRIIASYHLGPMEEPETRAYIEHRLRHAGWKQDPQLDDSVFAPIHAATGGIPRRINALCNRLLLGAYLSEKHELTGDDVAEAVAELQQELGAESFLVDIPPADAREPEARTPELRQGVDTDRRQGELSRPFLVSSITARLDRIERMLATVLDAVRGRGASEAAKPATPQGQRRIGGSRR
jgi:putative secretion ATPase (PEP-CTERM system associated)